MSEPQRFLSVAQAERVLDLFRQGYDTARIAEIEQERESDITRLLAHARELERRNRVVAEEAGL